MVYFVFFILFNLSLSWGQDLKIEKHHIFRHILQEMQTTGSSSQAYLYSENYRLDLSLIDLIDQIQIFLNENPNEKTIKTIPFSPFSQHIKQNFFNWWVSFKEQIDHHPHKDHIIKKLNQNLIFQLYDYSSIALLPEYKIIDPKKIKDRNRLKRIQIYNEFASNPEGRGLLASFKKYYRHDRNNIFIFPHLTVAKLKKIQEKTLKNIKKNYYIILSKIYQKYEENYFISPRSNHQSLKALSPKDQQFALPKNILRIYHEIQKSPYKNELLFVLKNHFPEIPQDSGFIILNPTFFKQHFHEIKIQLQEFTLQKILHSHDDLYLLSVRNFIKKNAFQIEEDLKNKLSTSQKLIWHSRPKKPSRVEALANVELLSQLYPDYPWITQEIGLFFNAKGKQVYFHRNLFKKMHHFLKQLGTEFIQSENYLSILAGSASMILTQGNLPLSLSTKTLVKQAIQTHRYDKDWNEFLEKAPQEVLNVILLSAGAAPGRAYKILALGSAQGALQSLATGQDILIGAGVGGALNLTQYYLLPPQIARPMSTGFDDAALSINNKLELLEKTIKATVQGTLTATLEGDPIIKEAIKGSLYGYLSTKLLIWFGGTRYNPFKDWDSNLIDETIDLENWYQNIHGRGGEYAINRQLILDANFRFGGVLPEWIRASITLPGNVAMTDRGFNQLTTLTHEAHHLMQQHQSGVFGFYLFRYIPTALVTGYHGHPDENFLSHVIGLF